jgi:hypothetical protein
MLDKDGSNATDHIDKSDSGKVRRSRLVLVACN